MDFIEKVVGLMSGKAAQGDAGAAAAPEPVEQPQDTPAADEAAQESAQGPKTYTPEELESLLAEKKKEWQAEQEAQEQERLRSLKVSPLPSTGATTPTHRCRSAPPTPWPGSFGT